MQTLPFRAVVSDMDGTLLNANHVVGDFTISTLEKLAQRGIDIVLATGRGYTDVSSILNKMQIEKAAMIYSQIGAQGGRIKQDISDNQLREVAARFKVTPRKDFL